MKLQLPILFFFSWACNPAVSQLAVGSFVTDLFKEVSLGVAAGNNPLEVSKQHVFGWALAEIGIANDEVGLGQISGQLAHITNTLGTMSQQLANIESLLLNDACDRMAENLNDEIVDIITWENEYNIFLSSARGDNNRPPTVSTVSTGVWAREVYDKMPTHLTRFDVVLTGRNSGRPLLETCLFNLNQIPDGGFDDDYWQTVYNYMDMFYSYQTRGLFLYTEAAHYLAYDAVTENGTIDLSNDDSLGHFSVCVGGGIEFCEFALGHVDILYNNILRQYSEFAGAPLTSDTLMVQYHTGTGSVGGDDSQGVMYPRSLEDFTADADESCSFPLTSNDPCGITTTDNSGFDYDGRTILNYSGWTPAHLSDLEILFMNIGGSRETTAGEYMESLGFRNTTNKIIFVMEETSVGILLGPSGNLKCFFDTDIKRDVIDNDTPIFCNQRTSNRLTQESNRDSACQSPFAATRKLRDSWSLLPSSRNGFYDGRTNDVRRSNGSCNRFWDERDGRSPPGWWETESQKQYSWPIIKLEDQQCKHARRNRGGAFTLCNDDLFEFLEEIVPSPPDLTEEAITMNVRAADYETSGGSGRSLRGSLL